MRLFIARLHPVYTFLIYLAYYFSRRFKGNRRLANISPDAFMGLASLRRLDLSQTAITNLPVRGLSELETLELIETRTLKEIPSVYNYKVNKSPQPELRLCIYVKVPAGWRQMNFAQTWIWNMSRVKAITHAASIYSVFYLISVPIDIRRNSSYTYQ